MRIPFTPARPFPLLMMMTLLPLHTVMMGISSCDSTDADGDGYVTPDDCDDSDPTVHPDALEVCDGIDNNCDTQIDNGVGTTYYPDVDADGYGNMTAAVMSCSTIPGYITQGGDCDDADPSVHPGASADECAKGIDFNCDGAVGTLVANNGQVSMNIPTVAVNATVTLNGQAVSASNTSSADYGSLKLRKTGTTETFLLADLYDTTNAKVVGSFTRRIIPGTYDLIYDVTADGSRWPDNHNTVLQSGVVITADKTWAINIPTVTIAVTTTLNGTAVSSSNTNAADFGEIRLRDAAGEVFSLYTTYNSGTLAAAPTYSAVIIPGTYDVVYRTGKSSTSWPVNDNTVLTAARSLTTSQALTVNVPTVKATLTVTLNGQAISAANTSASDEGEIELRDIATGKTFLAYSFWEDGANALASSVIPVLPGTYDIYYSVHDDGPHWPSNTHYLLSSSVAFTAAKTVTLNVPSINVTVGMTLGSVAVSSANTNAADTGTIKLRDSSGEVFTIAHAFDATTATVTPSVVAQVIPGTYDLLYGVEADGPNWPNNQKAVLKTGVALNTTQSLAVDVPYVQLSVGMSLAGQVASAANTSALDFGAVELREVSSGDRFNLASGWDTTTNLLAVPMTARVIPSTYDVLYDGTNADVNWPHNIHAVLSTDVALMASQTYVVNVPYLTLNVGMTLNGAAATSSNTNANDEGEFDLTRYGDGMGYSAYSAWYDTGALPVTGKSVRTLAGSYQFAYSVHDLGTSWPANVNASFGCFTLK